MTDSPDPAPPSSGGDRLDFTPVPTRARHDGWTPDRQRAFIAALAQVGVVAAAARHVGLSTKSAYALRDRPGAAGFAAAWTFAQGEGLARARDTAIEHAMYGVAVPVFYGGRQVGERRRYDHRLVLAALRIAMRERGRPADPDTGEPGR